MKSVNYKQGMTKVYVDEEKIVITNSTGKQHIKANVEQIFGMGEFDKIYKVKYSEEIKAKAWNPHSKRVEIVSGYIPQRALDDMAEQSLPGNKEEDLTSKYFKDIK